MIGKITNHTIIALSQNVVISIQYELIRTCCLEYLDAMFHAPLLLVRLVSRKIFVELQKDKEILLLIDTKNV